MGSPLHPAAAQAPNAQAPNAPDQTPGPALGWTADGLEISLDRPGDSDPTAPGWLVPVAISQPDRFRILLRKSESVPAPDARARPQPPAIPQGPDGSPRPDLTRPSSPALPPAPVSVLRRASVRGQPVAVLLVAPVFQAGGAARAVSSVRAFVPGVRPLPNLDDLWQRTGPLALTQVAQPAAHSRQPGLKIAVRAAGLQQIVWADVTAAGLIPGPGQSLRLLRKAAAVPLGQTASGLHFYAPPPGDRWNDGDVYWLTVSDDPPLPIPSRPALDPAQPPDAPARTSGWEAGETYQPNFYDSTLAGPDEDHFFAADLRAGPGLPPITHTLALTRHLPPAPSVQSGGPTTLTLSGSAYTAGAHRLAVYAPSGERLAQAQWSGTGNWQQSVRLEGFPAEVVLGLEAGAQPDGVQIDRAAWQTAVALTFDGEGGWFVSDPAPARYRLQGVPAGFGLYDVTDPFAPVRLTGGQQPGGDLLFDSPGPGRYFLADERRRIHLPLVTAGAGRQRPAASSAPASPRSQPSVHTPATRPAQPYDWSPAQGADVLYVAPRAFHPALEPLVQARQSAGYRVALVDVQAIYDGWAGGMLDPAAIRAFLRYAASTGSRAPLAVTLVGDGTSDPRDYTGRGNGSHVPPFLADVDPWLGETACDACFGQLDGASPLDDPLPDVWLGRIPAKSPAEVAATVAKILAYESDPVDRFQRARAVYITDNFEDANGQVDGAGNFALSAEASIAQQPPGMAIERVYYDPSPSHAQAPWREPDAATAYGKTLDALQAGGGFVNYIGHAHNWQWASTDLNADPPYLLGLFDVDQLQNGANLPILLEMTCLTGAFQTPAFSGTVLDERWLLNPTGGAAAVWGPTGLGVAYGHDQLQRGFYRQFWGSGNDRRLGALTGAGYAELFSQGLCCQEPLRTYVLFGDPLTTPRVEALSTAHFPLVYTNPATQK